MQKVVQTILFTAITVLAITASAGEVSYEKIYKKQCATCHGNEGNGKGRAGASFSSPPTDFTASKSTAEQLKAAIRDGVAGTSMVAYKRLFDEELLSGLTDFIQTSFMSRKMGEEKVAAPGREIYDENCSACHGDKGQSAVWAQNGLNPPPRNFTTAIAREELSRERMITSVTHGRQGTAMMSFSKRLTSADIEVVVDFIRGNFMLEKPVALTTGHGQAPVNAIDQPHAILVDMQVGFSGSLVGDATIGKRFYDSNCFTCHGKKGDGKGPRSHFNYPRPRNFTTDDSRLIFNRPRLFKSISHGKRGSVMPAWEAVLSEQEIANVAEYVFQQFILNNDVGQLKKKP